MALYVPETKINFKPKECTAEKISNKIEKEKYFSVMMKKTNMKKIKTNPVRYKSIKCQFFTWFGKIWNYIYLCAVKRIEVK